MNSPYPSGAEQQNTLYTAFGNTSPKYLDPVSSYSTDETDYVYNIYEPLYGYHYLARPYRLIPRGAAEVVKPYYLDISGQRLPDDAPAARIAESVYDIPLRSDARYQPHPAFARRPDGSYRYFPLAPGELDDKYQLPDFAETDSRPLTAQDYVYAFRRLASPRLVSPGYSKFAEYVVGLPEYGDQLRKQERQLRAHLGPRVELPWLDLREGELPGVQALDDHHLRIRIKGKNPQFDYWLAMTFTAPIPWEADRFYSQPGMAAHNLSFNTWPVGTGPYRLVESIQNRRLILERNPNYRADTYPCKGGPGDREQGLLEDCGKRVPMIDRAVFISEKEAIPLQGKFLQGYYDTPSIAISPIGTQMLTQAGDSREIAERNRERGLRLPTGVDSSIWYLGFNWLDPVVGQGSTDEQRERNRKLRQALAIAFDWESYVTVFLNNNGIPAHGPVAPGFFGYEPLPTGRNPVVYALKGDKVVRRPLSEAKRLLAEAGYPDGRDASTGQPLILQYDTSSANRAMFDWMRQQTAKLGIQLEFRGTDYNRFQDRMRKGAAQLFFWGWVADYPDAENFLGLLYGPAGKVKNDGENASNYSNADYDRLFEEMQTLSDGPEKIALIRRMVALVQQDAPWLFGWFPVSAGAYQQWVYNAKPTQMVRDQLRYLRLDPVLRERKILEWNQPILWPLGVLLGLALLAVWPAWRILQRREHQTAFGDEREARP
ncbi:ABC transporter substrate-binding protein [Pseudomonas sp. D2-5]